MAAMKLMTVEEVMAMYPGVLELVDFSQPETVKPVMDVNDLTLEDIMAGYPGILELVVIPEP